MIASFLAKFASCNSGVTAVQYALIAALIGIAIVSAAKNVGTSTSGALTNVSAKIK